MAKRSASGTKTDGAAPPAPEAVATATPPADPTAQPQPQTVADNPRAAAKAAALDAIMSSIPTDVGVDDPDDLDLPIDDAGDAPEPAEVPDWDEATVARAFGTLKAAGYTLAEAQAMMTDDPDRFARAGASREPPPPDPEADPRAAALDALTATKPATPAANDLKARVMGKLKAASFTDEEQSVIAEAIAEAVGSAPAPAEAHGRMTREEAKIMGDLWADMTRRRLIDEGMDGLKDHAVWARVREKALLVSKTGAFKTPPEVWEAAAALELLPGARKTVAKAAQLDQRARTRGQPMAAGTKAAPARPMTDRERRLATAKLALTAGDDPVAIARAEALQKRLWASAPSGR